MSRRQAREAAMQILYELELAKGDARQVFQRTVSRKKISGEDAGFTERLVFGTLNELSFLDGIISQLSNEWNINRLAYVDKNLLRMSLYEMLYLPEIPLSVSINEAIELAKMYGGQESPKFVNGILGRVAEDPARYSPQHKARK